MVDRVDINSVLMQMRQVKSQLRAQHAQNMQPVQPQTMRPSELQQQRAARLEDQVQDVREVQGDNRGPDFQVMVKNAIDTVSSRRRASSSVQTRVEQGDPWVDLPEVLIAMQKSSVSFQAMTQVRNKLVEAYKDIMNMPV